MTLLSQFSSPADNVRPGVWWLDGAGNRQPLPALEWTVVTREWSNTATIKFVKGGDLWPDGFDINTDEIFVSVRTGSTWAESVLFVGHLNGPQPVDADAEEMRLVFTETDDAEMQLPVTTDIVGSINVSSLVGILSSFTSWDHTVEYTDPHPYPTLPSSPIYIYRGTHPTGPMSHPTFNAIVDWMDYNDWETDDTSGGESVDVRTYLYYDEPSGDVPSNPYWFPGPWDQAEINDYPNDITVVEERYEVHPSGELRRRTEVDKSGDSAPSFVVAELSRSAWFRPAGGVTRDIRASQLTSVGSQLRSLAEELGLRRTVLRGTNTGSIKLTENEPALTYIVDQTEIIDHRRIMNTGGVTHVAVQGVDDAWAVAGNVVPGKATKVLRVRAEVRQGWVQQLAKDYLAALDDATDSVEITVDAPPGFRTTTGDLPANWPTVGDRMKAIITVNSLDQRASWADASAEGINMTGLIGGATYRADRDANVTATFTLGKPVPTVQDLVGRLV